MTLAIPFSESLMTGSHTVDVTVTNEAGLTTSFSVSFEVEEPQPSGDNSLRFLVLGV